MAAAIELSTSPNVPPAPAAGMYWSRAISFGRGPSRPLRAHTSNLIGEHLYVFGGCDIKACFNTLYILDMDTLTWSKPRTTGDIPPPCRAHSCTTVEHDVGNGRRVPFLYVFGGGDGPNYFNNLYVLNTERKNREIYLFIFWIETFTWTKPNTEGIPPSPRRAHTTCSWNSNIIVVGGGDGARALADVHCLDLADPSRPVWSQMEPSGTAPIARGYHTSNLVKDKLIVFGGSDGHECFSDVFVLDLVANKWSQVDVDRAIPRLAHTATQIGSYIFVIGGHDGNRYSNDVLLLNLVTMSWESRKIYGGAPSPRGYHTAVLHDSRLYILGGYDGKNVFEDIYLLELSSSAYLSQITNFDIDV
ncbi:uncharacterized protein BX664DRAFT_365166 [Halteromyces radiatus]|uniref:uncharacterized protein n=1 Tax=Halteromyces radiatus TaxID=101107 RepID=UPI002220819B|nr:uncharacterized protein BX664DRAFT_365166 [Halteromyces radiatus]KAI8088687.1 hypothetical protein BX664DRAFT_365166 [Halteromyces radiatus]